MLEPTEAFFMAGNVMVRAWTGGSDHGQMVIALIAGVLCDGELTGLGDGMDLVSIPPPDQASVQDRALDLLARIRPDTIPPA